MPLRHFVAVLLLAWIPWLHGCTSDAATPPPHSNGQRAKDADETPPRLSDLEDRAFPLLIWSAFLVEQEYFDKDRFDPQAQLLQAMVYLGLHTPEFFAEPDATGRAVVVKVRSASEEFRLDDVETLADAADRLEKILEFTQRVLVLDDEPLHELEYAAINGLLAPLDPHTILLTPEEHTDLGVRTKGEFGGIGAQIRPHDRRIQIVRVLPGMPAEKAGVEDGDLVLKIGGESTVNMTATEAQNRLRGPVGSPVSLKLQRAKTVKTVEIVRDVIRIDSVRHVMLPGNVGYLRIESFQESTAKDVGKAIIDLTGQGEAMAGLVIDLRGNSGGLLAQATGIIDQLVSQGELVIVRSAAGREVDEAKTETLLPGEASVVVLLDERAASASEIVGGGLQALGRAVVLGRSSFGKGTVQMIKPASPYGRELALKLTVAEYLLAGDRSIQSVGVTPDLELHPVELTNIVGVARYFDLERFDRERERAKTAHLPSAKHDKVLGQRDGPAGRLRYLWTSEIPSEEAPGGATPEVVEQMRDPEVRIARTTALALHGSFDPEQRRRKLAELSVRLAREEDDRISKALGENEVEWSGAPEQTGDPSLEVKAELLATAPIKAGAPFGLRVEVRNVGTSVAQRVHVITNCVHDELDGIELLMGTIEPRQWVRRDLKLHVMPWHTDFSDTIGIEAHAGEPGDEPDGTANVMLEVKGAQQPSLSYDYWIVDDPALSSVAPARPDGRVLPSEPPFTVSGNGDGVLQPGERVLLAFSAANAGVGESPDLQAILRNHSGTQGLLEEGSIKLGVLRPGDRLQGAFGISMSQNADPSVPFEVELLVGDGHLRTSVKDKLRFRVLQQAPAWTDHDGVVEAVDQVRLYGGAHASAPIVAEVTKGTRLPVIAKVGNWYVLAGGTAGRRTYVPVDVVRPTTESAGEVPPPRRSVLPPDIELGPVPRVTTAARIKLHGVVKHPRRVRDVVVLVRPPGVGQYERKVHYAAAKPGNDEPPRRLDFEAEVPLEPGGNRVTILARDGAKVERRRDLWVFRE